MKIVQIIPEQNILLVVITRLGNVYDVYTMNEVAETEDKQKSDANGSHSKLDTPEAEVKSQGSSLEMQLKYWNERYRRDNAAVLRRKQSGRGGVIAFTSGSSDGGDEESGERDVGKEENLIRWEGNRAAFADEEPHIALFGESVMAKHVATQIENDIGWKVARGVASECNVHRKERIARVVEECMERLADDRICNAQPDRQPSPVRYECDQRLMWNRSFTAWLIMKIIQTIFIAASIIIIHHEGSCFEDIDAFLPMLALTYSTLAVILFTKLGCVLCFHFAGTRNPHSLLYIVTSALLTLITATLDLILMGVSGYYATELQLLAMLLISVLESCVVVELYLCYAELKKLWNKIGQIS